LPDYSKNAHAPNSFGSYKLFFVILCLSISYKPFIYQGFQIFYLQLLIRNQTGQEEQFYYRNCRSVRRMLEVKLKPNVTVENFIKMATIEKWSPFHEFMVS